MLRAHALPVAPGQLHTANHSGPTRHHCAPRRAEPYSLAYLVPARLASDLRGLPLVQYAVQPLWQDAKDAVLAANTDVASIIASVQREPVPPATVVYAVEPNVKALLKKKGPSHTSLKSKSNGVSDANLNASPDDAATEPEKILPLASAGRVR